MEPVQGLPTVALAMRCGEESQRHQRNQAHTDSACYELFRRATVGGSGDAQEALVARYRGLVRDWIWGHALASSIEDHDHLATRAFERFWQVVQPERFAALPDLASVLRYLKLCLFAALIDDVRGHNGWAQPTAAYGVAGQAEYDRRDEAVVDEIGRVKLWAAIERALPDAAERLVAYLSCVIGLKPREIARRHGEVYPSVDDVYRIKRLALERIREDAGVQELLHGPD